MSLRASLSSQANLGANRGKSFLLLIDFGRLHQQVHEFHLLGENMATSELNVVSRTDIGDLTSARKALNGAATIWYFATVLGQAAFVLFILLFYYPSSLSGNFAAWDKKPNIEGYLAGDTVGNIMFAFHVLVAAVMTVGGLFQLVPSIRQKWPKLHRWNGRIFMITALSLAFGGLWLVWGRGTYLNLTGGFGVSFSGLLIIGFSIMAWRSAVNNSFAEHRRWALRLFVVVSAVWYMRLGYMIWGIGAGGIGIGDNMDGPYDYFLAFGNSLVPLAIMEGYLRVKDSKSNSAHYLYAGGLVVCALLTLGGSAGAWMAMWGPYI
jgi:Predicted membrane protein (DUF2306)